MLPEVARQAVDHLIERDKRGRARVMLQNARLLKLLLQLERVRVIAAAEEARETFGEVLGQVEDFADFARRAFAAVSNTVGRHGDPFAAVAMIELLDDALAAVLAGQIEI